MEYRSIKDLSDSIRKNIWKIPRDIDLVVGVPRSGMLPASITALLLNLRFTDIDSFMNGTIYSSGQTRKSSIRTGEIKKVLIVDDTINSGGSMQKVKEKLAALKDKYSFTYMVVFASTRGSVQVDIFCEIIDGVRMFEWNLYHNADLKYAFFDIDGVFCKDPVEDDDGIKYTTYIKDATPLFIPTVPVGTIISCRLEKYRGITEEWLSRHGIRYDRLIMLDMPDKATRVKWGRHGEFKAENYKNSDALLFIESSFTQANKIASLSHKPVYCVETNSLLFYKSKKDAVKDYARTKFPRLFSFLKKGKKAIKG